MLDQRLYSNMEQHICRCRVESPRATTMATTKFLYDRHKTNVDTSENLINNAEDVENKLFKYKCREVACDNIRRDKWELHNCKNDHEVKFACADD